MRCVLSRPPPAWVKGSWRHKRFMAHGHPSCAAWVPKNYHQESVLLKQTHLYNLRRDGLDMTWCSLAMISSSALIITPSLTSDNYLIWSHVLAKSWAQRKGVDCCNLNQPRSLKSQKIEIQNMKTSAENMEFDLMMASGQMVVNI